MILSFRRVEIWIGRDFVYLIDIRHPAVNITVLNVSINQDCCIYTFFLFLKVPIQCLKPEKKTFN